MARNTMKQIDDKWKTKEEFFIGDWVFLKLQPYKQTIVILRKNMKLNSCYFGLYKIIQKIRVVDKLLLPITTNIHLVFSCFFL